MSPCLSNRHEFEVIARDGNNRVSNRAKVIMNVLRNQFPPDFLNLPFNVTIGECDKISR